jgi:hypothetical protein
MSSPYSHAERASLKPRECRSRRLLVTLVATGVAVIGLVVQAPVAGASIGSITPTPDVAIVPFAGDVFTVGTNGSLITVDPRITSASAPLFNLEGEPLNLTWGQFSSASAKSVAWTDTWGRVTHTDFLIGMSGLIPRGVYSLFYRTLGPDSVNPACAAAGNPDIESTVALPAAFPQFQKSDPDSFVANSSGRAFFAARVAGNLLAAQSVQVWVVYHFDGNTYGPVPNNAEANSNCQRSSYGIDAMRQFLIAFK